jgi:tetratricopeptide (TPR) repeat protein
LVTDSAEAQANTWVVFIRTGILVSAMSHPLEQLLSRAQEAVRSQSWTEAWALLEQINPDYLSDSRHLGSLREEFELLAATVTRHRGQLDAAERLYESLKARISLADERVADVLLGLAECAHARGDFATASQQIRVAEQVPTRNPVLGLRVQTSAAHIASHVDLDQALRRFEWITEHYEPSKSTAWANLLFWYGDALLVDGQYERSVPMFVQAHGTAIATGATITAADAMRRLPLARILCGQTDFALKGVGDLHQAERLYELAGDRGAAYLHTEAGEVYRAIGQWREADREFTKGLWGARSIPDLNREAHNQLGLFELSRVSGAPKLTLLDEAARSYDRIGSDWGLLHVHLCRAMGDAPNRETHLRAARELIARSRFSQFSREQQMIAWLATASANEIAAEPHLMNYP